MTKCVICTEKNYTGYKVNEYKLTKTNIKKTLK